MASDEKERTPFCEHHEGGDSWGFYIVAGAGGYDCDGGDGGVCSARLPDRWLARLPGPCPALPAEQPAVAHAGTRAPVMSARAMHARGRVFRA